ncbi:hypothetical protein L596_026270 [Steinernema carpocapsae]|nr:hypothetical protein L596_026270 [Steinernema carpocapsae]
MALDSCMFTVFDKAEKIFQDKNCQNELEEILEEISRAKPQMKMYAFGSKLTKRVEEYMEDNYFKVNGLVEE